MAIQHVKSEAEFQELINSGKFIVVDFFATWCGPCKLVAPKFEKLSEEHTDAVFVKIDVDELPDIAANASVRAMPTFHIYKDGEKVAEIVGANPAKLIETVKATLA